MAQSEETRLALVEERTLQLQKNVSVLVDRMEKNTSAMQKLNETMIRNESIKQDVDFLRNRISGIEGKIKNLPVNEFQTKNNWETIKGYSQLVLNTVIIAALAIIGFR